MSNMNKNDQKIPDKGESIQKIGAAIRALEVELGLSITIIDNNGVFRTTEERPLLGHSWQSHQKNAVCRIGFCDACIQHCRYEINATGARKKQAFVHRCWKQVNEIVVPLIWEGHHLGSLFAGCWRSRKAKQPFTGALPATWRGEYEKLPYLDRERVRQITPLLETFALGLLKMLEAVLLVDRSPTGRRAEVQRFLRYHFAEPVRIPALAEALHLSPSRTSHLVKEMFGQSFQELLKTERIQAAKNLLQTSDLTLNRIAKLVGLCDEFHFSRLFKATVGIPPGRFRREHRGALAGRDRGTEKQ